MLPLRDCGIVNSPNANGSLCISLSMAKQRQQFDLTIPEGQWIEYVSSQGVMVWGGLEPGASSKAVPLPKCRLPFDSLLASPGAAGVPPCTHTPFCTPALQQMDKWVREEDPFPWEDKEEKAIARWARRRTTVHARPRPLARQALGGSAAPALAACLPPRLPIRFLLHAIEEQQMGAPWRRYTAFCPYWASAPKEMRQDRWGNEITVRRAVALCLLRLRLVVVSGGHATPSPAAALLRWRCVAPAPVMLCPPACVALLPGLPRRRGVWRGPLLQPSGHTGSAAHHHVNIRCCIACRSRLDAVGAAAPSLFGGPLPGPPHNHHSSAPLPYMFSAVPAHPLCGAG